MKRNIVNLIGILTELREQLTNNYDEESRNEDLLKLVDKTLTKLLSENNIANLN